MDKLERRLGHFGIARDVAAALVEAGYSTPRLIKAASDAKLLGLPGIGESTLTDIREKIG